MKAELQPKANAVSPAGRVEGSVPPLLATEPRPLGRTARLAPVWAMLGFVGLLVTVALDQGYALPWPQCGLRTLTGIPCAFCGSTRCLNALAHLQWRTAIAFNPFVAILCGAFVVWFGLWLSDRWLGRDRAMPLLRNSFRKPWARVWIGLILANWIYLALYLPR